MPDGNRTEQTDDLKGLTMKMRTILLASVGIAAGIYAQSVSASEWGCEVLLCAASSNPSWRGVQACHPPMNRLISAMKRPGFSWPTCPEGGAGKPGYEEFAECPAGWTPTSGGDSDSGFGSRLSHCMRSGNECGGFRGGQGSRGLERRGDSVTRTYNGDSGCDYSEYMDRPRREEPYYFDIEDVETKMSTRHYFRLQ